MLYEQTTLNCKGKLIDLSEPIVMGVLNVTPDSFFDGGQYTSEAQIILQTEKMLNDGATIIDVGGMSSRPGARVIKVEEELDRVLPAIQAIRQAFPNTLISIDTVRAKVAEEAVKHGASLINDISAGSLDEAMFQTVANLKVPYILMHMQGRPETMQDQPVYKDVILEVIDFMIEKIGQLRGLGVKDLVIDPGFGFGKEISHNFQLLKKMHAFKILEVPILAGISRKSFIYNTLNISPEEALTGTTALHMIALEQGAKILRVHDVKEAVQTIKIWQALENR